MAQSSSRNSIETRISLTGGEEVKSQFEALGKKGEEALSTLQDGFKKVSSAAKAVHESVGGVFERFTSAIPGITGLKNGVDALSSKFGQFTPLLNAVIPGLRVLGSLSAGAAAAGLFAFSRSAAESTHHIQSMSGALALSSNDYVAYQLAAARAGLSQEAFDKSVARTITSLAEAKAELEDNAFKLRDLEERTQEYKLKQEILMRDGVRTFKGTGDAVELVGDKIRVFASSVQEAQLIYQRELRKMRDEAHKLEQEHKKLVEENPWKILGIDISKFGNDIQNTPRFLQLLVDRLNGLSNPLQKAQIASKLWGREWREVLVDLQKTVDGFNTARTAINRFGLSISDSEVKESAAFRSALGTLEFVADRVKTIVGNIMGESLVPFLNGLTLLMVQNLGKIKNWATEISRVLFNASMDILSFIQYGDKAQYKTDWVPAAISILNAFRQAIGLVVSGFNILVKALDPVAAGINYIFGTNLDGKALLMAAAIFHVMGGFNLL
jgi:hypothetical protein